MLFMSIKNDLYLQIAKDQLKNNSANYNLKMCCTYEWGASLATLTVVFICWLELILQWKLNVL